MQLYEFRIDLIGETFSVQPVAVSAVGDRHGLPGGEQAAHLLPPRLLRRHHRPLHRAIHA